jgi:uncharacterized protein YbjT (DUF2867 family)
MNILLTGPTGYIGRRLKVRLLEEKDVRLRLLVKDIRRVSEATQQNVEVIEGDLFNAEDLRRALTGIDIAYYPIRFFWASSELDGLQKSFARDFRDACIHAGVKKIIFLGVLGSRNTEDNFLRNVIETGEALSAFPDKIRTIWLRAGFVIGSGSSLFEVLRNLAQKVPVIFTPRWMEAKLVPLGIADTLEYLTQARNLEGQDNLIIDLGAEMISFRDMLKKTLQVMGLKRIFMPLPFTAHRLFSFLLMLVTPFSYTLSFLFIQALKSRSILPADMKQDMAERYFPGISPLAFQGAMERALNAIERNQVISRWTDSLAGISYADAEDEISRAVYRDVRKMDFSSVPPEKIFRAFTSIGGKQGWFTFDILWRMRGFIDKLAGGFGTALGKRVESELRIGDMLDVWKVVDLRENERLLLEAQMKVGGKAWLEFVIDGTTLVQTAYHLPKGLFGRLYWYSMLPFHFFIFRDMIKSIVKRAEAGD